MASKKVIAASLIGVAVLSGAAGALTNELLSEPEVKEVVVTEEVVVNNTVVEEVEVIKEVPVEVTVEKIVEVENVEFKAKACDRLFYDEVSECVEEVDAEDAALQLAIAEIENELADYLDDEDVVRKESDVRIIDIKSDFEDLNVVQSDFDDNKYVFEIDVKYEDERKDKKDTVTVKVRVEDGDSEIRDVN